MRSPTPGRLLCAGALLVTLSAGVAACGDEDPGSRSGNAPHGAMHDAAVGTTASAQVATAAFVRQMIPHHEMAVVMARAGVGRAEHPELKQLTASIISSQTKEIAELKAIARAQGIGLSGAPAAMGRDARSLGLDEQSMGMSMHTADLAKADPFDRAFLDMMIPHHQGAISMAEGVLTAGATGRVAALARSIVDAQTREVSEMKTWRKVWYGDAFTPAPSPGSGDEDHGMGDHDMGDHDMDGAQ